MARQRFSERYGHRAARTTIQVDRIDGALRTAIWNALLETCFGGLSEVQHLYNTTDEDALRIRAIWRDFFGNALDDLQYKKWHDIKPGFRDYIETAAWYDVYDLLQELVHVCAGDKRLQQDVQNNLNVELERHLSGYRIIKGIVTPITSDSELESIDEATSDKSNAVRDHFVAALELMSDRTSPDYRNSIKESVSAVEAIVREVSGKPKAVLSDGLRMLKAKHSIHPALELALQKLYAYAGDESGIRHALSDTSNVTLADAKLMLVLCSAFCNYIREICSE